MENKKSYLTLNELHESGKIWWIKSRPTLKKWVEEDRKYKNILQSVMIEKNGRKQYYFLPGNVQKYIEAYQMRRVG